MACYKSFAVFLLLLSSSSEYQLALYDALVLPADFPFLPELLTTAEQSVTWLITPYACLKFYLQFLGRLSPVKGMFWQVVLEQDLQL